MSGPDRGEGRGRRTPPPQQNTAISCFLIAVPDQAGLDSARKDVPSAASLGPAAPLRPPAPTPLVPAGFWSNASVDPCPACLGTARARSRVRKGEGGPGRAALAGWAPPGRGRERSRSWQGSPALPLCASKCKQPHHPDIGRSRPQLYLHDTREGQ